MKVTILQTAALSIAFGGAAATTAFAQTEEFDDVEAESAAETQAFEEETDDVAASLGVTSDDPIFEAHKKHKAKDRSALRAKIKEVCSKVNATEDQKKALGESMITLKRDMITLNAEKKVAKLDYLVSLVKADSQRADADSAGTTLTNAANKIAVRKVDFANDLFFDILKQEQRAPALKCLALIKKVHKHRGHDHD